MGCSQSELNKYDPDHQSDDEDLEPYFKGGDDKNKNSDNKEDSQSQSSSKASDPGSGSRPESPSDKSNYSNSKKSKKNKKDKKKEKQHEWSDLPNVSLLDPNQNIEELFSIDRELGRGGSCRVLRVTKISDRTQFAMKELLRDDEWNPILFRQEIAVLHTLRHPNILEYCEAYVGDKYFYICTRLCTGGELFDKVKKLRHFSEKMAAEVLTVILRAIGHVHDHHIVHRDLKPENIVYDNKGNNPKIVLIDFGDAAHIPKASHIFSDFVGTPFYLAPECVRHRSGWELYKSDMWAIGVIAYVLLTGRPPFWGRNNREILGRITRAQVHWPNDVKLSRACKNFIMALLQKDPRRRLSAKEALNHVWILTEAAKNDQHLGTKVLKNIAKFSSACKLKKLIVSKIVKDMTEEDKAAIIEAFRLLDTNGDGVVDLKELQEYLENTGLDAATSKERAKELMLAMDKDGDGKIDLNEFVVGRTASRMTTDDELIKQQFDRIASSSRIDKKGTISANELMSSFGDMIDQDDLQDIMKEVDKDGDGQISLEEFQKAMQQKTLRPEDVDLGNLVGQDDQNANSKTTDRDNKGGNYQAPGKSTEDQMADAINLGLGGSNDDVKSDDS